MEWILGSYNQIPYRLLAISFSFHMFAYKKASVYPDGHPDS